MQAKSPQRAGCRVERGAANGRWRGGRTRHKRGYLMVYAAGHPRASNPYVFEHILVAEELLGRYLTADETIHHRNAACATNNRPENLELCTRPQPSGIRVSDAVSWAREILARYEGACAPPTTLTARTEP